MYEYILKSLLGRQNYNICNVTNIYNFIMSMYDFIEEDKKKLFISNMKLILGMSFYTKFKLYIYEKIGTEHEIIKYL